MKLGCTAMPKLNANPALTQQRSQMFMEQQVVRELPNDFPYSKSQLSFPFKSLGIYKVLQRHKKDKQIIVSKKKIRGKNTEEVF